MSYLDQHAHAHHRATAVVGVGAIHVIIAAGLALGLTVKTVLVDDPPPFEGINTVVKLPPPPDETVEHSQIIPKQTPPQTAPRPPIDLRTIPDNIRVIEPSGPVTTELVLTPSNTGLIGPVLPPSLFDPIPARPRNGPQGWITNNDYPGISIRHLEEGNARYQVSVATNGRVEDCRILSSTGYQRLDEATCQLLKRRARFDPAKNANGEVVAGSYTGTVTWQIPE